MSELYLGVDAGNSKTVALLADGSGAVVGRGRAGVGDIYGSIGASGAVSSVMAAVRSAVRSAGARLEDVRHAAFRLAGVDWDEDESFWHSAVRTGLPELSSWSVKNDGYALLRCGDLSGVGLAITAGTGPAVAARGPQGVEYCASWWIQDTLGGRGLGFSAFTAVMNAELGLAPPTALTQMLLRLYALPDVEALLYAFTNREDARPSSDKWRAARSVLVASEQGDEVSKGIVRWQVRQLAGHARVAAAKAGFGPAGPVTMVLGGSVLSSEHGAFREALVEELYGTVPGAVVTSSVGSPLAGSLLDALAEAGMSVTHGLRDRVVRARHPEDFLLTD